MIFVAFNIMFLVSTTGVWAQHGDFWWVIPSSLWMTFLLAVANAVGGKIREQQVSSAARYRGGLKR